MSKQSNFELDESDAEVQRIDRLRIRAERQLTELTDLLKRVDHLWHNRCKMWCREEDSTWFVRSNKGIFLYTGPSLLEALRVLVGEKEAQS